MYIMYPGTYSGGYIPTNKLLYINNNYTIIQMYIIIYNYT